MPRGCTALRKATKPPHSPARDLSQPGSGLSIRPRNETLAIPIPGGVRECGNARHPIAPSDDFAGRPPALPVHIIHMENTVMAITSMEDLLVHELRDLYNAEKQLIKALPSMAEAASDEGLVAALESHLVQTEEQARRLELCFDALGVAVKGKKCAAMEGLIEEATDVMEDCEDDNVRDAAIIGAAQRVEHYEISAYGTARAFARRMGDEEAARLLDTTLEEESQTDEKLNRIAEKVINAQAARA